MVIGKTFAWGHMGKTGGDATLKLFQQVQDIIVFAHPQTTNDKHLKFQDVPLAAGKDLVLNMRRLPSVVLSHVNHIERYGMGNQYPKGTRISPEDAVAFPRPEGMIRNFTDGGQLPIARWLRMEHLRDDFLSFLETLRPVTRAEADRIRSVETKAPMPYDHDPLTYFTSGQIERLYRNNPTWAAYEKVAYGDVPVALPVG